MNESLKNQANYHQCSKISGKQEPNSTWVLSKSEEVLVLYCLCRVKVNNTNTGKVIVLTAYEAF